jgi:NNMT/PNMT/TEMT family
MAVNADYDWNTFDAWDYLAHNYASLREGDQRILELTRDFFTAQGLGPDAHAVDVGTGTNLYPALAMLPFCSRVNLLDHSASNIEWLTDEVTGYSGNWDAFWRVLADREPYRSLADPRAALCTRAFVRRWNLLEARFLQRSDLGTMFFVAESISTELEEFQRALRDFCALLKPCAPFAVAFMENSLGYKVGDRMFPAVRVAESDVRSAFEGLCDDLVVYHPDKGVEPLREGYTGVILVHGTVAERWPHAGFAS